MLQDLRHSLRALARSPGFACVVVATLAIGIGVNSSIFSVVSGMLLQPLPYADPTRVMTLWESNPQLGIPLEQASAGTYRDWSERTRAFAGLAAYSSEDYVLGGFDEPEQLMGATISASLLSVLGVTPQLGRGFTEEDVDGGNAQLALLSHGLWQRRFGGDESLIGSAIELDSLPFVVVGVMPPEFEFPPGERVDLWTPLVINPRLYQVRGMRVYDVVGRLAQDASVESARADVRTISAQIAEEHERSNRGWSADVVPALDQVLGGSRTLLGVLAGAAFFVLVICCVNVTNMLLARGQAIRRDFAVRSSLGASRLQLLRRSICESVLLGVVGGGLGLLLSLWAVGLLRRLAPPDLPRSANIEVDLSVVAFTFGLSLVVGIAVGLAPALRVLGPSIGGLLHGRGGGDRRSRRLMAALVSGEVASALILLVAAIALLRSFDRLLDVDPGFRTEGVVAVNLSLPDARYEGREQPKQFFDQLLDRIAALPGVDAVSASSALPMSQLGQDFDLPFEVRGSEAPSQAEQPRAEYRSVYPGYFETLEIPLLRGRLLDRFDRNEERPVMVVNDTMDRIHFSSRDSLTQTLGVPMAGAIEIVGVVGDVKHRGLGEDHRPEMFVAYQNFPLREMHVVARGEGDPERLLEAIGAEIRALDPQLPVIRAATLGELVSGSLAQPRFNAALISAFAISALALAALGIYGVISYSVSQRRTEIGIRMALGADGLRTVSLILRQAVASTALGGVLGVGGALLVGRALEGFLFEVEALDPLVTAGVLAVLLAVALLAALVPSLRANRIDPVSALRVE